MGLAVRVTFLFPVCNIRFVSFGVLIHPCLYAMGWLRPFGFHGFGEYQSAISGQSFLAVYAEWADNFLPLYAHPDNAIAGSGNFVEL